MITTFLLLALLAGDGPAIPDHFKAFTPLIGKDWRATFQDGKVSDVQRFEWIYGGKFMRNTHWVRDAAGKVTYEGETVYAWDYKKKRLAWYYFNTSGGHMVGWVEGKGNGMTAYGANNAPGQTAEVKGEMLIEAGQFISVQYFMKDGAWAQEFRVVYKPVLAE